jgi:hypothetical protein
MERSSVVRSIHWLPILIVVGAGLVPPAGATEKHWIAHEADAIVVGTLTTSPTFPWVDGWHINGVIRVDETLYGGRLPSRMNFRLVCRWDEMCRWWPPPVLTPIFKEKGLWFLRRLDNGNWKPSVGLGFQRLSDRAYWENSSGFTSGDAGVCLGAVPASCATGETVAVRLIPEPPGSGKKSPHAPTIVTRRGLGGNCTPKPERGGPRERTSRATHRPEAHSRRAMLRRASACHLTGFWARA